MAASDEEGGQSDSKNDDPASHETSKQFSTIHQVSSILEASDKITLDGFSIGKTRKIGSVVIVDRLKISLFSVEIQLISIVFQSPFQLGTEHCNCQQFCEGRVCKMCKQNRKLTCSE